MTTQQKDRFEFEIEVDGTITLKSGAFGRETHHDADAFLETLEQLAGSRRVTSKRPREDLTTQSQHQHHHKH